jgi:hypothetical protein
MTDIPDIPLETARKNTRKQTAESRAEKAHKPARRTPMGVSYKVSYPDHLKDHNFFYYFVADQGGKVQQRLDAGYEFVKDEAGNKVIRHSSDGVNLILMRQPMEYREEDLAIKRDMNYSQIKAEQSVEEGFYKPGDRKNVIQRDDMLDPLS